MQASQICGPAGDIDTDLAILDAAGGVLAFNDDVSGTTNFCSTFTLTALTAGPCYIRVRSSQAFNITGVFTYQLQVDVTP